MNKSLKSKVTNPSKIVAGTEEERAIEIVKENAYQLKFLKDELRDNKNVVMEALKKKPDAYKYASEGLQKDPDIVIQSCCALEDNFKFNLVQLSERLKLLKENGNSPSLKMGLSKRDNAFFDDAINLLDDGDYFNDITMDMSFPYVADEDEELEHLQEERDYLDFVLDIIPDDLLNKKTNSKGIQKIFQEEVERRKLMSLEKQWTSTKEKPNTIKRKVLIP